MVKQINWKDFKIKDLQPNLIPNGWDSFEPYGSGKNYVENWDFSSDMKDWNNYSKTENNTVEVGYRWSCWQDISVPQGQYVVRAKFRKVMGDSPRARINFAGKFDRSFPTTDEWDVREFGVDINDESKTKLYLLEASGGGTVEFDWIQITPVDNQHLVVEKTPLENGLTRIQTWGGNDRVKLIHTNPIKTSHTTSFFLKTDRYFEYLTSDDTSKAVRKYEGLFFVSSNFKLTAIGRVLTLNVNGNLDFIASDPQIVEGDKPNPTMIVTELDDGREHVQVHGAYPDTELVYKGGGAVIGEPYVIESEIENLGAQLQMESTLDSVGKVIDKGINQVSIKGTTDSKDFEIGVKLRDGTI